MSDLIIEVCMITIIEEHPNADRLALATIKGWNCVVGLNAKEGDLVVFCPPDSVIPMDLIEKYELEYLKKDGRVKTVKLRGAISQGLILDIPEGKNWRVGQDVAKELGITKYEPPESKRLQIQGQPTRRKRNPLFDKYTDISNIKNYNTIFKVGEEVVISEKIHGSNFRAGKLERYGKGLWNRIKSYFFGDYEFVYGSHNVQITGHAGRKCFYGEDVYGRMAKKYNLDELLQEDYIVYGEIHGKGIQELEYGMEDIDVRFFDIKYKGKYLDYRDFISFCQHRNLPMVPLLYKGKLEEGTIEEYTKGNSIMSKVLQIREGCVVKPLYEENNKLIGRKVLKSINPEYLLKKDRTEFH